MSARDLPVLISSVCSVFGLAGLALVLVSCPVPPPADSPTATATIESKSGSSVTGTATFKKVSGGVEITVTLANASPGKHGVHLHEKGDCSAADGASAGGHFDPDKKPHGAPDSPEHHAGDFGNIEIGQDGTGTLNLVSKDLTVEAGERSVVGRAIIVHEKEDDFGQPTGNAGGRIGCGVVKAGD